MESYYDRNADNYFQQTWQLDLNHIYSQFLRYVPSGKILDVSCGSGRDAYHFVKAGYEVTAFDESHELIAKVKTLVKCRIEQRSFYDFNEENIYDGIWCCASLLHCSPDKLETVLISFISGLKPSGTLYMSFKLGVEVRHTEDRTFLDINEYQMSLLMREMKHCYLLQQWITTDIKQDSSEE